MPTFKCKVTVFRHTITKYIQAEDLDTAHEILNNTPVLELLGSVVYGELACGHSIEMVEDDNETSN